MPADTGYKGGLVLTEEDKAQLAKRPVAPEKSSWCLSQWTYGWITPMLTRGNKSALELQDLYRLQDCDATTALHERWSEQWKTHGEMSATLGGVFKKDIYVAVLWKLLKSSLSPFPSLLLKWILEYLGEFAQPAGTPRSSFSYGILLAVLFATVTIATAIFDNRHWFVATRTGYRARSAISAAVYQKSLTLAPSARQKFTTGEILNLMTLDSGRVEMFCSLGHMLYDGGFQIIILVSLLIYYIGASALAGFGLMLFLIPIQGIVMFKLGAYRTKTTKFSDERVKLENEALHGIRVLKMYGWLKSVYKAATKVREKELNVTYSAAVLRAVNAALMMAAPPFVGILSLIIYSTTDNEFSAGRVFAALAVFNQLRFPLMFYPWAISTYADYRVAKGRLNRYLQAPDMDKEAVKRDPTAPASVKCEGATFRWATSEKPADGEGEGQGEAEATPKAEGKAEEAGGKAEEAADDGAPALSDLTFEVTNGELLAVVGPVGSGKSSLVASLLGELELLSGNVSVNGSVAYVAQTAWIMNMSVRDNILFGKPYDSAKYRRVKKMCQLEHDIEILPDGDNTMIGERGINLSGGQKQRIAVARAVYADADVYIFDDPLSALDAEVGRAMFDQCILEGLTGKCRILVTNQLQVVPQCDKVLVLERVGQRGGQIAEFDSYANLMSGGMDFATLMGRFGIVEEVEQVEAEGSLDPSVDGRDRSDTAASRDRSRSASIVQAKNKMMEKEERETGAVKWRVYWAYIKAGSLCLAFGTVLAYAFNQLGALSQGFVVALWTEDAAYVTNPVWVYMLMYAGCGVLMAVCSFIRTLLLTILGLRASKRMHNDLLWKILNAPVKFFDTNPMGRIVSRFSKDMDMLDNQLPNAIESCVLMVFLVVGMLTGIISQTPLFIVALIPWGFIYYKLSIYFRNSSREMQRLQSITRSPVYAQFTESLGGLSTIRAFGHEERFQQAHYDAVDTNNGVFFLMKTIDRWLSVRLQAMGALVQLIATLLCVWGASEGTLSASFAGFTLSLSLGVVGVLSYLIRTIAEMENAFNSAERILQYTEHTGMEGEGMANNKAPETWPSQGAITFDNVVMQYREDTPLVLKGCSFVVGGGEKIGIAGRTGSGKSSLLQVLFRMVEVKSGRVLVDGVDISTLSLPSLRSRMAIIPQDPLLLSGTLRYNLDPFGKHTDAELWEVLERVQIADVVRSGTAAKEAKAVMDRAKAAKEKGNKKKGGKKGKKGKKKPEEPVEEKLETGLATPVAEGGENFSAGQRQLLCLARVMLRKNKILVLDEATSSVDMETDRTVQEIIRSHFSDCTILTIAHRLHTIIDSTKILVMDDGHVAELDSPATLLEDPDSNLSALINELGAQRSAQLRELAAQSGEPTSSNDNAAPNDVKVSTE